MSQVGQPYTKYWFATINNPSSNELPNEWPDVEFCHWQREKGAEGTEHLQVYVGFTDNKRRTWINRQCVKAHWEPRKGPHAKTKEYVTKVETRIAGPWSIGCDDAVGQGKRNDLKSLKRKLDAGASLKDVASDDELFGVVAKYHRWIPLYLTLTGNQRTWPTETIVYWGAPGIGKSSRVLAEAGPEAFWLSKPAGQTTWWDGYHGQEVVVIDEFYGWIARDLMCRLCDRYPLNVETKGGSTSFRAKKIYITSNEHPSAWWPKVGLGAMIRRLSAPLGKVVEMTVPWQPPAPAPAIELLPIPQALIDLTADEPPLSPSPAPDPPVDIDGGPGWDGEADYINVIPRGPIGPGFWDADVW